jgi:hypothetical protein
MSRFHSDIELPRARNGMSGEELSPICQSLLDQELKNALVEGRDYKIDLQVNDLLPTFIYQSA